MLYYIVTEDKKGASGYQFYELLNKQFLNNKFEIYSAGELAGVPEESGNSYFEAALRNLAQKTKGQPAKIFIAYDNQIITLNLDKAAVNSINNCYNMLENAMCKLSKRYKNVKFYEFKYICFEELFLLLPNMPYFIKPTDVFIHNDILTSMQLLLYCINTNDFTNANLLYILKELSLEKFIANIVTKLTTFDKFTNFKISKSGLGVCWKKHCSEVKTNRYCQQCTVRKNFGADVMWRNKHFFMTITSKMKSLIIFLGGL